jgi:hypothetical protein
VKVLLAVINCHSRDAFQDAIRSTWLPQVPPELTVRFFLGRGADRDPRPDEVFLDCGDEYLDLPEKVQAMIKWAYDNGFDYAAKCDDDVVLRPSNWYSNFSRNDFSGWQDPVCKVGEIRTCWGFLYTLSRRSMELVIKAKLPGTPGSMWNHKHNNDEAMVASVLHYNGIYLTHEPRHFIWQGDKTALLGLAPAKRSLRFNRGAVPKRQLDSSVFATVIYLNWTGWHNIGPEIILSEFHKVWNIMKEWK